MNLKILNPWIESVKNLILESPPLLERINSMHEFMYFEAVPGMDESKIYNSVQTTRKRRFQNLIPSNNLQTGWLTFNKDIAFDDKN